MATADQIKSLLQSHYKNDDERFTSIALQVAAHEARKGNMVIAKEIKSLIDKSKSGGFKIIKLSRDISDLVLVFHPENRLSELILSDEIRNKLLRIITEYKQRDKIQKFGLHNRRKVLLSGIPGTGKTITASAIAGELKLPLYVIMMDKLMTKYMGETAAKLRDVFNMMQSNRGVYLFDEFDAIGAERARDNEVGEMRRVLNAFLQFIEQDTSDSIILGATNNIKILDSALFRRFDDIITYTIPNSQEIEALIVLKLSNFLGSYKLDDVIKEAEGLSHAEITNACNDALKEIILTDKKTIIKSLLIQMIRDRKMNYL
ncbi:AAA family ATPase [Cellulophaga tyrosinoxydans]|uniref:ATPase family associated with various cellular activities (AAA) n=1 Tax=Cellulophaga tyrosinoxydans TaxID=504486 RepID=A0A1W1YZM9_9FLAO|nr:ATP-binding protein [Cellulophaga tyrosinoxydans]SMC41594.1 ATPase family associated with various cellular activities (AAA) [Cellulophaga tyrosinoxydans]